MPPGGKLPAADDDNFFLANMVAQWRNKADRPALVPSPFPGGGSPCFDKPLACSSLSF